MKLLEGKTALITGAARGIGKALAIRFAREGANIAFTDLVIDENGEATKAEIAALGVKVEAYASNAADFEQTQEVVAQVVKDFGRVDILVNNAGITKDGLLMRMTEAQWDAVLTVNLKSAFNFCKAVVPVMMKQRGGSIINMASVVGVHGNAGQCNYAASKAGLIALAKSIAQEVGSRGIRANAIAPRLHRNRNDRRSARERARGVDQEDSAAPRRQARGHRRRGNIPGFRYVELRHRPGYPGRRRHEHVIIHNAAIQHQAIIAAHARIRASRAADGGLLSDS